MTDRPYVVLSCAASLDGCLDDAAPERLRLSSPEDFDEIDELRSTCDAILVGATTVRRDRPRLLLRSEERRQARRRQGKPEHPAKVVVTRGYDLDPEAPIFADDGARKLVYGPGDGAAAARSLLGSRAEVVAPVGGVELSWLLADLRERGVERLLVEGGATVLAWFIGAGAFDRFRLAIAPIFVGDPAAPRLHAPPTSERYRLVADRHLGDTVILELEPSSAR